MCKSGRINFLSYFIPYKVCLIRLLRVDTVGYSSTHGLTSHALFMLTYILFDTLRQNVYFPFRGMRASLKLKMLSPFFSLRLPLIQRVSMVWMCCLHFVWFLAHVHTLSFFH